MIVFIYVIVLAVKTNSNEIIKNLPSCIYMNRCTIYTYIYWTLAYLCWVYIKWSITYLIWSWWFLSKLLTNNSFNSLRKNYFIVYLCTCTCVWQVAAGAHGTWKRASSPPELDLQMVVSSLSWVLRTELWSTFFIFPAPFILYL